MKPRRIMQGSDGGKWFSNNNSPVNPLKTVCMLPSSSSNFNKITDVDLNF